MQNKHEFFMTGDLGFNKVLVPANAAGGFRMCFVIAFVFYDSVLSFRMCFAIAFVFYDSVCSFRGECRAIFVSIA